jgi:WD40 repeat protein
MSLAAIGTDAFAVGDSFGTIHLIRYDGRFWETAQLTIDSENGYIRNGVCSLAYYPAFRRLAVGCHDWVIRVIDLDTWQVTHHLRGHKFDVVRLAWSPDGSRLASVSWDKTVRVWDVVRQCECCPPIEHPVETISLAWGFAPDQVITTWNQNGIGGTLRIWDSGTGNLIRELCTVPAFIESVATSHQNGLVATGSLDGYVRIWNAAYSGMTFTLTDSHDGPIRSSDTCVGRQEIATISFDGVRIWSSTSGKLLRKVNRDWSGMMGWNFSVRYSPEGQYVVAVVGDTIYMHTSSDLSMIWSKQARGGDISRCYFSSDSKRLLTDDEGAPNAEWIDKGNGTLVWDVKSGTCLDRSNDWGLDAEDRFREYEETVQVGREQGESGTTHVTRKEALIGWQSYMRKVNDSGNSEVMLSAESGHEINLKIFGLIKNNFRLKEFGKWIVIRQGGSAPCLLSVQWPSSNLERAEQGVGGSTPDC